MCCASKNCMESYLANEGFLVPILYKSWNGKLVPVYAMKVRRVTGGRAPLILNVSSTCRWVISLILQILYPQSLYHVSLSSVWLSICAGDRGDSGWCPQSRSVSPDSCIKCSGWVILCPLKPRRAGTSTHICSRSGWVVLFAASSTRCKCSKGKYWS